MTIDTLFMNVVNSSYILNLSPLHYSLYFQTQVPMMELIPAFAGKTAVPAPFSKYLLKKDFLDIGMLNSIGRGSNTIMTNRMYNNDIDKFAGILNDNDPLKVINIDSEDIDNAGNASHDIEMDIPDSGHIKDFDKIDEDENKISIFESEFEVPFTFPPRASFKKMYRRALDGHDDMMEIGERNGTDTRTHTHIHTHTHTHSHTHTQLDILVENYTTRSYKQSATPVRTHIHQHTYIEK